MGQSEDGCATRRAAASGSVIEVQTRGLAVAVEGLGRSLALRSVLVCKQRNQVSVLSLGSALARLVGVEYTRVLVVAVGLTREPASQALPHFSSTQGTKTGQARPITRALLLLYVCSMCSMCVPSSVHTLCSMCGTEINI